MWSVILLFAAYAAADGDSAFRFQVTPEKIQPGEHAVLEIRLRLAPGEASPEAELPVVRDELLANMPGLQIIDRDFRKTDDEWIWRFDLTTYALGTLRIPPLEVRRKGENFSTETVKVEVATTRTDKDNALRPEFGTISRPFPWGGLFACLLFAAVIGALGYWVRRNLDRWRKKIKLPVRLTPAPPAETPEAWLRRELQRIRERINTNDTKVIDDLGGVWRGYFARRTAAPVEAWTSFEMALKFSTDTRVKVLFPLWVECDHYKFAGQVMDPRNLATRSVEESERVLLNVAAS